MSKSIHRKELIVIYRQEILKDIRLFTSQPVAKFYDSLFLNLDLSFIPEYPKQDIVDTSFIGLDSTPVAANTSQNNPKSFLSNKFKPDNQPKADPDCKLGVHTASNQTNEKKYEFYWGYKNHVLVDCISGLPIYELTTTANVHDSTVALDILADTHAFLPITECTFLADNGRTRQKFCCTLKSSKNADCPCHHKNFYNGKKHRGCTKYITIPDDLRLSIDRNSKYFKSSYSLRTECERYNSHFKSTGQERMWVKNKSSVANLNTLAHISLLAVAVATVTSGIGQSYRKLKAVKRIA